MKIFVLALLSIAACGPVDRSFNNESDSMHENNIASLSTFEDSENCDCEYYQPEDVTLIFSQKSLEDEVFNVNFVVREQSGKEFGHSARLGKDCAQDFEKRREIPATLERKKLGTCSPIFIQPKGYDLQCWHI